MKIESKILSAFFKKVTLDGNIPTAKLISNANGIDSNLEFLSNIIVSAHLENKAFAEFDKIDIDVRDSKKYQAALRCFKGQLAISINKNFINMSSESKVINFKRASKVENIAKTLPKVYFDNGIDIGKDFISEIIKNISITEAESVLLAIKDNVLTVIAEGQEDNVIEKMPVQYKDSKFRMSAEYFKNIFGSLENDLISISFQDLNLYSKNPPLKIIDKGELYKIEIWIAPFNPE